MKPWDETLIKEYQKQIKSAAEIKTWLKDIKNLKRDMIDFPDQDDDETRIPEEESDVEMREQHIVDNDNTNNNKKRRRISICDENQQEEETMQPPAKKQKRDNTQENKQLYEKCDERIFHARENKDVAVMTTYFYYSIQIFMNDNPGVLFKRIDDAAGIHEEVTNFLRKTVLKNRRGGDTLNIGDLIMKTKQLFGFK